MWTLPPNGSAALPAHRERNRVVDGLARLVSTAAIDHSCRGRGGRPRAVFREMAADCDRLLDAWESGTAHYELEWFERELDGLVRRTARAWWAPWRSSTKADGELRTLVKKAQYRFVVHCDARLYAVWDRHPADVIFEIGRRFDRLFDKWNPDTNAQQAEAQPLPESSRFTGLGLFRKRWST